MNPNISITCRVWCSPRADSRYPWKWAVQNDAGETLESGAEETEQAARLEATAARASWISILTD
jgi:hypothetical protein